MEFEALKQEVFELARQGQLEMAEQRLLETKPLFQGKALGRWHHLYAQVVHRLHPDEHKAFNEACVAASRLLQMDHAGLTGLYLTQMATAMSWGDWSAARVYIRRMRAFFRRYPNNYEIQRLEGHVLINEGIIESVVGNFSRAISLSLQALEAMDRYMYPPAEQERKYVATSTLMTVADCYLRLGQHAKTIEYLAKIDPNTAIPPVEYNRYCYVQSRYWLALNVIPRTEEWFAKIGDRKRWEPDWPALLLELEAGIASAKGNRDEARRLLQEAIEHTIQIGSQSLMSLLRRQLTTLEEDKP